MYLAKIKCISVFSICNKVNTVSEAFLTMDTAQGHKPNS